MIVYNLSWDMKMSQGKSKTMPMQIFGGVEAVYYGIVQVVNENDNPIILALLMRQEATIITLTIHSKYFPVSVLLKPHA